MIEKYLDNLLKINISLNMSIVPLFFGWAGLTLAVILATKLGKYLYKRYKRAYWLKHIDVDFLKYTEMEHNGHKHIWEYDFLDERHVEPVNIRQVCKICGCRLSTRNGLRRDLYCPDCGATYDPLGPNEIEDVKRIIENKARQAGRKTYFLNLFDMVLAGK
jgi:diadenosine tetraphosphatase ApaH/serine/threonine PP2A family protein phosphatase